MRYLFFFSTLFYFPFAGQAQITVDEPSDIRALVQTWGDKNARDPYASGWRVQVSSTNDLHKADEMKTDFQRQFPEMPVDWVQEYPYYKIRVGAFLEKNETKVLISRLLDVFPGAFAVKENRIPVSEFLAQ